MSQRCSSRIMSRPPGISCASKLPLPNPYFRTPRHSPSQSPPLSQVPRLDEHSSGFCLLFSYDLQSTQIGLEPIQLNSRLELALMWTSAGRDAVARSSEADQR